MKYMLILGIIALVILAGCSTNTIPRPAPGEGSQIDESAVGWRSIQVDQSVLEFEGTAVGKSHLGTFDTWTGELELENGKIVGAKGVIDAASVATGIEGLNNHLRSEDFFDVETYPEIIITSTDLQEGMMTADLTFRGITKSISFPVTITENSLSADFILDTRDFAMKYIAVNKDVRIAFTMVI